MTELYILRGRQRDGGVCIYDGSCLMHLQPAAPTSRSVVAEKQTETARHDQQDGIENGPMLTKSPGFEVSPDRYRCAILGRLFWPGLAMNGLQRERKTNSLLQPRVVNVEVPQFAGGS
jgi:hypothetical protein